MIPLSTSALVPVWLPWELDAQGSPRADATKWEAKAATVLERQMFEAEIASPPISAREVLPWEWADVAARAIDRLSDLADRDRLNQVIALHRVGKLEDEADRQLWAGLCGILDASWPEWQGLTRRQERRNQLLPVLACQWFLKRRNGEPLPTDQDGRLTNDALAALDFLTIQSLGSRIYRTLYGWEEAKNSDGPSPSGGGPKTSQTPGGSGTQAGAGRPSTRKSPSTRR